MTKQRPPRVFISYSHDGDEHETRVLDLANRLREDGIDAELDQYEDVPAEGWPLWCEARINEADFVLLVCTEPYLRRVEGEEEPDRRPGVVWEARIIRQLIYDARDTRKFVPVMFEDTSTQYIPTAVKGTTRWLVSTPEGYEGLYRQLTHQPKVKKPVLGGVRPMPPKSSRSGPAVPTEPAKGAMGGTIFISYRREEDAGFAGRLYDQLERTFRRRLFMDVDSIAPGQDFVSILETRVAECDVLLAIIGRGWLTATDAAGRRRLDNHDDFVRIEIAAGLARGKRVIPVLINDVPMPPAEELPEEIKPLVRRQALRLSHERFKADTARLIRALRV